jgi:hypoxanthine phosphoribosyltransferase
MKIKDKEFTVFISRETIENRVRELASDISRDYSEKNPLFVVVLNGAFMFASDLFKAVTGACEITFLKVSSYQGTASTGKLSSVFGLQEDLSGRHIVILEDIVDTGLTIFELVEMIKAKNPASVEVATFLHKPDAVKKEVSLKYIGFDIPPSFVIGYGLDYNGLGRNLPEVYVLKD